MMDDPPESVLADIGIDGVRFNNLTALFGANHRVIETLTVPSGNTRRILA